jgi:hypothetical protein
MLNINLGKAYRDLADVASACKNELTTSPVD